MDVLFIFLCPLGDDGVFPGFTEYMYREVLPACFMAPLKASFDLNDGHSYLVSFVTCIKNIISALETCF